METFCDAIAILFGIQLAWSYYRQCYSKGYTIDVWHYVLLNMYFIVHVMLPFARSDLNVLALGSLATRTQAFVTEAYLISALGYAAVLLGGSLWRLNLGWGLRNYAGKLLESTQAGSMLLLRNRGLLILHGMLAVTLIVVVLAVYFSISGFGFNLRGLLLTYPPLRPLAQFTAFYSVLIGSLCLARFAVYRDRIMLAVVSALILGLLFFGERSNLLAMVMLVVQVMFLRMGRRLRPIYFLGGIMSVFFGVFLLNLLREPNFSLENGLQRFALDTFYGNSYSDTRDFALVLSFWDGHHFFGMTYLAGLLAFIPRFLSPFRDHWAIGVVTATMAGFSPQQHPGLRPGAFGEVYLNFGVAGVTALGVLIGLVTRFIDQRMKQSLAVLPLNNLRVYSYWTLFMFVGALEMSANASALYSVFVIFFFSWVFQKVLGQLDLQVVGH